MKHIELVIFENNSIINEKALSLPIGKVSFRQIGVIMAGVLFAILGYFITKNIIIPGTILGIFLTLGMINTKVMTLDQLIKANLIFVYRGTSLEKNRPQKIKKEKTISQIKSEKQVKQSILTQVISIMESLYSKKNKKQDKRYSIQIELTRDNQLKVSSKKLDMNSLQERINIVLDNTKQDFALKSNHISLALDKSSKYDISTIIDESELVNNESN